MRHGSIEKAAKYIDDADSILIAAGAGIGVDSGLPDFRGDDGFWNAYPALRLQGTSFTDIASPESFLIRPETAWGFYGHRLNLYRKTVPHLGFHILKALSKAKPNGYFVFTSNVDGQFQKVGFDAERIVECHGSIHHLQCTLPCIPATWSADTTDVTVNEEQCRITSETPDCIYCGELARPNILMFSDFDWVQERYTIQSNRYKKWLEQAGNVVVIELGAGLAIPSVRNEAERAGAPVIRINPRDSNLYGVEGVSLAMGARQALEQIIEVLAESV